MQRTLPSAPTPVHRNVLLLRSADTPNRATPQNSCVGDEEIGRRVQQENNKIFYPRSLAECKIDYGANRNDISQARVAELLSRRGLLIRLRILQSWEAGRSAPNPFVVRLGDGQWQPASKDVSAIALSASFGY